MEQAHFTTSDFVQTVPCIVKQLEVMNRFTAQQHCYISYLHVTSYLYLIIWPAVGYRHRLVSYQRQQQRQSTT